MTQRLSHEVLQQNGSAAHTVVQQLASLQCGVLCAVKQLSADSPHAVVAAATPSGLLIAFTRPALPKVVPWFAPPTPPPLSKQPAFVWTPIVAPSEVRMTGEPELPPVVSAW